MVAVAVAVLSGCSGTHDPDLNAGAAAVSTTPPPPVMGPLKPRPARIQEVRGCRFDDKFSAISVWQNAIDPRDTQIFADRLDRPRDGQGLFVRTSKSAVHYPSPTVTEIVDPTGADFAISGHFEDQAGVSDFSFAFGNPAGQPLAIQGKGVVYDSAKATLDALTQDAGAQLSDANCGTGDVSEADVMTCTIDKWTHLRLVETIQTSTGAPTGLAFRYVQGDRPRDGQGAFDGSIETLVNIPGESAAEGGDDALATFSGNATDQSGKLDVTFTLRKVSDGYKLAVTGSGSVYDALMPRLTSDHDHGLLDDGTLDDLRCSP
jgi:hypothetical protein